MSEYQYYEFLALDRPLGAKEQAELRAISSRATISSTRFANSYSYGDLKANPADLVDRYFDAHLYLANWGTRALTFRFQKRLLRLDVARRYCVGRAAAMRAKGEHSWWTSSRTMSLPTGSTRRKGRAVSPRSCPCGPTSL